MLHTRLAGNSTDCRRSAEGPENAGATAGGFKIADYRNLKEKLQAYMGGDRDGFTKPGLDLLKSREKQLASALGMSVNVAKRLARGGERRGMIERSEATA